mgnify:CR=1 FL=1
MVFSLAACSSGKIESESDKLRVVCTLFVPYDFVREIAGDRVDLTLLLPPGMESHSYDPTPADMKAVSNADLLIRVGENMETWSAKLFDKSTGAGEYLDIASEMGLRLAAHEHEHEHLHHEHAHHHHHEHRNLFDVNKIIDESEIDEKAKDLAKRIFLRVAKAESKVHNETLENVHFHEVGAIDSIVDIIGTAILLCKINPDVIYSSVVNDGYGFIECAHGMISVPVPATSEIFAASNAITRQIDVDTELVTPTGAAIIAEIASEFTTMPAMNVQKVGWGTGTKDLVIPNVLKVSLGEIKKKTKL